MLTAPSVLPRFHDFTSLSERSLLRPPALPRVEHADTGSDARTTGRERIHASCRRLHARVRGEGPGCALSGKSRTGKQYVEIRTGRSTGAALFRARPDR